MANINILVVDDEEPIRELLKQQLEEFNYNVVTVESGDEAARALAKDSFDLVITDLQMPGSIDGIKLLEIVREEHKYIEVIIITGHASVDTAVEALRKGAVDYFHKPFKLEHLLIWIKRLEKKKELLLTLGYADNNKEKGFPDLNAMEDWIYKNILMAQKTIKNKRASEENRMGKARTAICLGK